MAKAKKSIKSKDELKSKKESLDKRVSKASQELDIVIPPEIESYEETYYEEKGTTAAGDKIRIEHKKTYYRYKGEECGEGAFGRARAKTKRMQDAKKELDKANKIKEEIEDTLDKIESLKNECNDTIEALEQDKSTLESFLTFNWIIISEASYIQGADSIKNICGKEPHAAIYTANSCFHNLKAEAKNNQKGQDLLQDLQTLRNQVNEILEEISNFDSYERPVRANESHLKLIVIPELEKISKQG